MEFQTLEQAYATLGAYLQAFIGSRKWDKAGCRFKIFKDMAQGEHWFEFANSREEKGGFESDPKAIWNGLDAALFVRDELLKMTAQRIWELEFTLYPDGKFNIEYGYTKPDGYEETDQNIRGDEIGVSLSQRLTKGEK